jgi:hypothetical protein
MSEAASSKQWDQLDERTRAAVEGRHRYQGTPCFHGHDGMRYTRNGQCVECQRVINQVKKAQFHELLKHGRARRQAAEGLAPAAA